MQSAQSPALQGPQVARPWLDLFPRHRCPKRMTFPFYTTAVTLSLDVNVVVMNFTSLCLNINKQHGKFNMGDTQG